MGKNGRKSICIVGAGPSGLYMLKNGLEQPDWNCTLFERATGLGGIWRFTPDKGLPTSTDEFPSPIHRDLIMNAPRQACTYLDYPWSENLPTFPTRSDAFDYLLNYARLYKLRDHMKFNQEIILVAPADSSNRTGTKWNVTAKSTQTHQTRHYSFDHVIVCTGHEMAPQKIEIENLNQFEGHVLHSTEFLDSRPFKGKRAVIRGAGPSGLDIMSHVRKVACEVILSTEPTSQIFEVGPFPSNVTIVRAIEYATKSGFVLRDGTELTNIDYLVVCNGYNFDYKFISPICGLELSHGNTIVRPLYRNIVNAKYPGLCFLGVIAYVPAFYAISVQVQWLIKFLHGSLPPVTEAEMNVEIETEQIIPSHNIYFVQWDYYAKLAQEAGITLLPHVKHLFTYLVPRVFQDYLNFRKDKYIQLDDGTFDLQVYSEEKTSDEITTL